MICDLFDFFDFFFQTAFTQNVQNLYNYYLFKMKNNLMYGYDLFSLILWNRFIIYKYCSLPFFLNLNL